MFLKAWSLMSVFADFFLRVFLPAAIIHDVEIDVDCKRNRVISIHLTYSRKDESHSRSSQLRKWLDGFAICGSAFLSDVCYFTNWAEV